MKAVLLGVGLLAGVGIGFAFASTTFGDAQRANREFQKVSTKVIVKHTGQLAELTELVGELQRQVHDAEANR